MNRAFKFAYASQLAGTFVILTTVLFVAAVFLAGRAKGWFEGAFAVRTLFKTEQGAFGLQEGSEVRIQNTPAGRVAEIRPTAEGQMVATFEIRKRFRPFVTEDAVAVVGKVFGVAGDAFVEIRRGKGKPVEDGAWIDNARNEEIMDIAQNAIAKIDEMVVPILDETTKILRNTTRLTGELQEGKGLAGTVLKDEALAADVKGLAQDVRDLVGNVDLLVQGSRDLVQDSRKMMHETTRLIRGFQKHWLVRRYIPQDTAPELAGLSTVGRSRLQDYSEELRDSLAEARQADEPAAVATHAMALAACLTGLNEYDEAADLLLEARYASAGDPPRTVRTILLEAEVRRGQGRAEDALSLVTTTLPPLLREVDGGLPLQASLVEADILCDLGRWPEAEAALARQERALRRTDSLALQARGEEVRGRICLGREEWEKAGSRFDAQAAHLREDGHYFGMAEAMASAAGAYAKAGRQDAAADRYFRACRSLLAGGESEAAGSMLEEALAAAEGTGDEAWTARMTALAAQVVARTTE